MFLDISKAFDRVRHYELLFKFKENCVSATLFELITSLLIGRIQKV